MFCVVPYEVTLEVDDLSLVMKLWRIFQFFFVLKLKIMKSFVAYTAIVTVCYRPNVLEKSIGYLETALLTVHPWYSLILSSCLISEVDPSVENWRALQSLIYLSLQCSQEVGLCLSFINWMFVN